jgi:hypothetical protein
LSHTTHHRRACTHVVRRNKLKFKLDLWGNRVFNGIKIFRRYMSILDVYKPGINSTVNELFVMYDITFVLKNAQVRKQSHVQHTSENNTKYVSICHYLFLVDEYMHKCALSEKNSLV